MNKVSEQDRRVQYASRLPKWVLDAIKELSYDRGVTQTILIEEALISYYGLKRPE